MHHGLSQLLDSDIADFFVQQASNANKQKQVGHQTSEKVYLGLLRGANILFVTARCGNYKGFQPFFGFIRLQVGFAFFAGGVVLTTL